MSAGSIEDRITKYNRIVGSLHDIRRNIGEGNCLYGDPHESPNALSNFFNIKGRIGGDSKFGEAHMAELKGVPNSKLAIKVIPVAQKTRTVDWTSREVFKEIRILDKLGGLVEDYITPNVPLAYDLFACKKCQYTNKNLTRRHAPKSCAIVLNELANGDLNRWMHTKRKPQEWKSAIFQILAGLTAVEETMGMWHGDLHDGNMLYTNIKRGGCWHYRFVIGAKMYDYYPPNTGQLWTLWDFGQSHLLRKTRANLKKMWKDVDRGIGEFMLDEVPAAEKRAGIKSNSLSVAEIDRIDKAIDDSYGSKYVPAFEVIHRLNWFKTPCGMVLNRMPYTVHLKAHV